MPFALNQEHAALADSAAKFAARHGALESARSGASVSAEPQASWNAVVSQGFHAIHLNANVGGQGGTVDDLAVVVAEFGKHLLPAQVLPTVIASSIASASRGPASEKATRRFADGARGFATWDRTGLVATLTADGWILEGELEASLGAGEADVLLVNGTTADGQIHWYAIDSDTPGIVRKPVDGVDLTRNLAGLRFDAVAVSGADEVLGLDTATARAIAHALIAVEASGVIAWCYNSTVEYLKTRHQFGRPIGSFQALQHRAAQLCITSELATAAAWDAIRALTESEQQRAHGVNAATLLATGQAVHAAVEALCMHGAIGFSWEHDLHLYWRRAISLAAAAGPRSDASFALGSAALHGPREFKFDLDGVKPEFRASVASVLDKAVDLTNSNPSPADDNDAVARGDRRNLLADSGLVTAHLPKPYGVGADATEQLIVREEFEFRDLQQPSMIIGEWVIPVILTRGTPEQIERVVGPTLRGEQLWCQLFSEPDAGSDMASLSLKATAVPGGWSLNGQKIWTTMAHIADLGLCLARTDPTVKKHLGLSMFIIDMHAPGIDVRPIKQANGASEFNEVFFNDVFVPANMLIGEPGDGWSLMIDTISQERLFIGTFTETGHEKRIRDLINSQSQGESNERAVESLGEISAYGAAIAAMNMRETLSRIDGNPPGAAVSIAKAASALLHTRAAATALDLAGRAGLLSESLSEPVFNELDIPTWIVGGGTLEIQLNAIASFVIGLPRG